MDDPGTDLTNKVLMKMISTMNDKMEAMATNVASLGSSVKRLQERSQSSSSPKKKRRTRCDSNNDNDESDASIGSTVSDSAVLRAIVAPTAESHHQSADPPSDLLSEIAADFSDAEDTSGVINKKLAEIVNRRFSAPLSEQKLKEKLALYSRTENCAKLAVPKVNPEISIILVKAGSALTKLADILLKPTSGAAGLDTGKLLTISTDTLA